VRTFVAVRPPAEAVEHLRAALGRSATAPERWHVTLAFLGEVAEPRRLAAPLDAVCAGTPAFALRLAGSGSFGRGGPVWVGVEGDVLDLTALAGDVARACRRAGADAEKRPYQPHLTVGRRGRPNPSALSSYAGPVWSVDHVELVVSHLGRTVEHEVVERLALAPAVS